MILRDSSNAKTEMSVNVGNRLPKLCPVLLTTVLLVHGRETMNDQVEFKNT